MKNLLTTLIFLTGTFGVIKSQDSNFSQWTKDIVDVAKTASNVNYLNDTEKEIIYLMNLARSDGKLFTKTYLKKYADDNEIDPQNQNYLSLIDDLKEIKNLPMLVPDKKLCQASEFHADDTGKTGITGHSSSDGTSFSERLRRYTQAGSIAENCDYGLGSALDIVCDLLIDEGVSSLGHRKNILGYYNQIGVALRPHTVWTYICVMDFAYGG